MFSILLPLLLLCTIECSPCVFKIDRRTNGPLDQSTINTKQGVSMATCALSCVNTLHCEFIAVHGQRCILMTDNNSGGDVANGKWKIHRKVCKSYHYPLPTVEVLFTIKQEDAY